MGFSFNPLKGITRALNIPDSARPAIKTGLEVVFPVLAIGNELAGKGINLVGGLSQPKNTNVSQSTLPQYFGQNPYNISFQAPSYQAPYYGGGGYDAYTLQPQSPYGGSPWGYSTMYSQPLIQPYQASSGQRDRTWEDLAGLAGTILPFFL